MSLKGITEKRANAMSGLTGKPLRQEESYDHPVHLDSRLHKNFVLSERVRMQLRANSSK
jgi:hypothetical protein